jgi:hypothetical protein
VRRLKLKQQRGGFALGVKQRRNTCRIIIKKRKKWKKETFSFQNIKVVTIYNIEKYVKNQAKSFKRMKEKTVLPDLLLELGFSGCGVCSWYAFHVSHEQFSKRKLMFSAAAAYHGQQLSAL